MRRARLLHRYGRAVWFALSFFPAVPVALWTVRFQRFGPEQAAYGNLCGPAGDDLCMEPRLNGGWPLGFLFDTPGVSRERVLAFFEDRFRLAPFLIALALYWALLFAAGLIVAHALGRASRRSA